MNRIFLLVLLAVSAITCKKNSFSPDSSFSSLKYMVGSRHDKVHAISKTTDGGFLYCGYTMNDTSGYSDAFLLKVNAAGEQQWYRIYKGSMFNGFRHAISTSDGGFIAVGFSNSPALNSAIGVTDYVVKVDSKGNLIWSKTFSPYMSMLDYIIETPNHDFFATGYTATSNTNTVYRIYLLSLNAAGDRLYQSIYSNLTAIPPQLVKPNFYYAWGTYLTLDTDGSILMGGELDKDNTAVTGWHEVPFLMKLNGTKPFSPAFLYPYYDFYRESGYSRAFGYPFNRRSRVQVETLSDGYLMGCYTEVNTKMQVLLIKTNKSGVKQWAKEYSGLGHAMFHHMENHKDGTFTVVAMSSKNELKTSYPEKFLNLKTMIMRVDSDGNVLNTTYLGSAENTQISKCLTPNASGGWNLGGYTTNTENGYDMMFWAQLDGSGNFKK